MKKLRLKALELGAKEVMTRSQLKAVFGGHALLGSGGCDGSTACLNSDQCTDSNCPTCLATGNPSSPGACGKI